jgi:VIT1/CCC1 family predicted Fe2+/Mn2+ transporter
MAAFSVGALLPLAAILLAAPSGRVAVTAAAVVVALALTGWTSANLGGSRPRPAVLRNVAGGVLAMTVTYAIGSVVGLSI